MEPKQQPYRGTKAGSSKLTYPLKGDKVKDKTWQERQEEYWARRSGKVETSKLTEEELAERKKAKRVIIDSPFRKTTTRA